MASCCHYQQPLVPCRDKLFCLVMPQWAAVCLKLPHVAMKTVFSGLVYELKRLQQKVPALPAASALNDRLNYLLVNGCQTEASLSNLTGTVDRALMYSESARRDTFAKWPHSNYKYVYLFLFLLLLQRRRQ